MFNNLQAVRHLPASAQLEYRTLVTRMRNLEKQKTSRHQIRPTITINNQQQQSSLKVIPFTVTIPNDQANVNDETTNPLSNNISTIGDLKITLKNTGDRVIQTCNNSSSSTNKPDSLMKQVLVKNISMQVQKQNEITKQETNIDNKPLKSKNVPLISKSNLIKMKQITVENNKLDSCIIKNVVKRLPLPLPEIAKMSDDDKRNVLKTAENDYVEHR